MHREFVEKGPPARAHLLFVLSWFHAVRLSATLLSLEWLALTSPAPLLLPLTHV